MKFCEIYDDSRVTGLLVVVFYSVHVRGKIDIGQVVRQSQKGAQTAESISRNILLLSY